MRYKLIKAVRRFLGTWADTSGHGLPSTRIFKQRRERGNHAGRRESVTQGAIRTQVIGNSWRCCLCWPGRENLLISRTSRLLELKANKSVAGDMIVSRNCSMPRHYRKSPTKFHGTNVIIINLPPYRWYKEESLLWKWRGEREKGGETHQKKTGREREIEKVREQWWSWTTTIDMRQKGEESLFRLNLT